MMMARRKFTGGGSGGFGGGGGHGEGTWERACVWVAGGEGGEGLRVRWCVDLEHLFIGERGADGTWMRVSERLKRLLMCKAERELAARGARSFGGEDAGHCILTGASVSSCIQVIHERKIM